MFRKEKKKDKKQEDIDEEYKHESEKLVEEKMSSIEKKMNSLDGSQQVDLSSIPQDLSDLETEIKHEKAKPQKKSDSISGSNKYVTARFKPELKSILPVWVEKPFYYITPKENLAERRLLWQKEWADFLLQWANAKDKYVIEIMLLQQEYPFKNPVINKQLKKDQLEIIGDYLVENEKGEWRSKNKSHIRVYWESLEVTADEVFNWAFERGLRYLGVFDILDSGMPFSDLSQDEIYKILVILVRSKKAEWADRKKEMAYLLFPS